MAGARVIEAPLRPVVLDRPDASRVARAAAEDDPVGVRPALAAAR
jgi:hypothetical protein